MQTPSKPPRWLKKIYKGTQTVHKAKRVLRENNLHVSFRNKSKMQEYADSLRWPWKIKWRPEQQHVIDTFFEQQKKEIVVQAIFGGGKTTILMAIILMMRLHNICNPAELFVCAFNVCIKNEIRKKLKICKEANICTFDSLIYSICKELGYSTAELIKPNFEGKRRFVFSNLARIIPIYNIRHVFIDECQDLERCCYRILKVRFPNANIVFVGDVFQSVQKEPRESMLWELLSTPSDDRRCIYMTETPRVTKPVLHEIKKALCRFYPEMCTTINSWKSLSKIDDTHKIKWKGFRSYQDVYSKMMGFIEQHGADKVMILTFSAAITVRGAMGDIARVRRFLSQNGIETNSSHKKMDDDKVFLSTANSSKGLERDYVFCFLSFPLEKAFANFSNDLVMNLITVALTRAKKKVVFYTPLYMDRSSSSLEFYDKAPRPVIAAPLRANKHDETHFHEDDSSDIRTVLEREWSTTEVLRQNILSFETREMLKGLAQPLDEGDQPHIEMNAPQMTEEQSTFAGLFFECMILSEWCQDHAVPDYVNTPELHEMFATLQGRLHEQIVQFNTHVRTSPYSSMSDKQKIATAVSHSKLHMLCHHKLHVKVDDIYQQHLTTLWHKVKPFIKHINHTLHLRQIKFQHNLAMSYLTGIADAYISYTHDDKKKCKIYELKASRSPEWKQNALLQALMYGIMSNCYQTEVYLFNAFSPKLLGFRMIIRKDLWKIRKQIIEDIQVWNLNCFLAKNNTRANAEKTNLNTNGMVVIDINRFDIFPTLDSDTNETKEIKILWFDSPTKTRMITLNTMTEAIEFLMNAKPLKIFVGRFLSIHESVSEVHKLSSITEIHTLFDNASQQKEFQENPVVMWFEMVRGYYNPVKNSNSKTNLDWSQGCSRLSLEACVLSKKHNLL